jgi:hypothetical protein
MNRDSSVGTAAGWMAEFRFPASEKYFSLLHNFQTGFGSNSASYLTGFGGCIPWVKAAEV